MATKILFEGYTFDDVLIRPMGSSVDPRDASLETKLAGIPLTVPFLSAAMDRVTEAGMAIALGKAGGLGVLHRNCTIDEQVAMVQEAKAAGVAVAAACGPFDTARALALDAVNCDVIAIDCAHGHNLKVVASAKKIKSQLKRSKMMFGNIATKEAAKDVVGFADIIKVGVGPGSICTTRLVTGAGVPQLTAIMEVVSIAAKKKIPVVADGGIRTSGDIAKALAAGASAVMLGNMFAGTDEAPGAIVERDGVRLKEYRGMGSAGVIGGTSGEERYLTKGRKAVPEGVEALVPCKGSVNDIIATLASGVQAGMGYVGAKNLEEMYKKSAFVKITHASLVESKPHTLTRITG